MAERVPDAVGGDGQVAAARDRAVGALLGLACGDAVGTTLEFTSPGSFTPIDDMVGGGPFRLRPGEWTDDTSMALCLAESVLDRGGLDPVDQMRRDVMWWTDGYLSSNCRCFDIGNTVSSQLSRFRRTGDPIDPRADEDAAANGSLMRLAPVPIRWHADPAMAAERSGESSHTTHPARRPVDACRVLGAMTSALIGGERAGDVFAPAFWQFGDVHPQIGAIVAGSWQDKAASQVRGSGFCVDALEAAIWAVAGAPDFRRAVVRTANLGDDADTTAAIAGQLAGARWGASGIPVAWRDKVVMRERIEAMASRLFDAGRAHGAADAAAVDGPDEQARWPHDHFLHAWWVEPGAVLAGEYPGDPRPERTAAKVKLLVDHGVRTFVDLTAPGGPVAPYAEVVDEAAVARGLVLRRHNVPIPDMGTLDDDVYDRTVATIRAEQQRGAVFVHCWGGLGRTGTVIGCLLIDAGLAPDDVVARLADLRAGTRNADRASPETEPHHAVLARRRPGPRSRPRERAPRRVTDPRDGRGVRLVERGTDRLREEREPVPGAQGSSGARAVDAARCRTTRGERAVRSRRPGVPRCRRGSSAHAGRTR